MDGIDGIDDSVPHSARIFNYWLGGKDHYPTDREAGDRFVQTFPEIVDLARTGRHFLARVVRYLADEAGIRQFLDIGTGLPTVDNTHEIAQRVTPGRPDRLCRQRPARPPPRAGPAHQHPGRSHRLHPGRSARTRNDHRRRRTHFGL
jgi:hypothetical protein